MKNQQFCKKKISRIAKTPAELQNTSRISKTPAELEIISKIVKTPVRLQKHQQNCKNARRL